MSKGLQRSSTSDRPTVDWETLFEAAPISHPSGMQRSKSIVEFQQLMRQDAQAALRSELDRLIDNADKEDRDYFANEFNSFANLFERFLQERGPSIEWENIRPPREGMIKKYDEITADAIPKFTGNEKEYLNKLVVVKLNGGLGTSMGCTGPKSVIAVRGDLTFLDLTVQQIEALNSTYNAAVPLVLMNSFNTDEDTSKIIRKYKGLNVEICTFNQSCYPRINKESYMPVPKTLDTEQEECGWYPPGHGDFYESFKNSGLLEKFVK